MTTIETIVCGIGILFLLLLLAFMALALWIYLDQKSGLNAAERQRAYLLSTTSELICWCGHEFPQIEDAARYLITHIQEDGRRESIDAFRGDMRRKYKNEVPE